MTAAASATVACASGTRISSVPKRGCGRTSHHHSAGIGQLGQPRGVVVPALEHRRHALARQQLADRRPDAGQPGVAAGVDRRVGGERGDERQLAAQRVVDRQRPVGAAHRDVDLQREDELAPRDVAEQPGDPVVALAVVEHAERRGERDARRPPRTRSSPSSAGRQVPARGRQPGDRLADRRRRRQDDLELRGGQLELEALVAAEPRRARRAPAARGRASRDRGA